MFPKMLYSYSMRLWLQVNLYTTPPLDGISSCWPYEPDLPSAMKPKAIVPHGKRSSQRVWTAYWNWKKKLRVRARPSLIHCDLWYGNTSTDLDSDGPIVYDAYSFYAHNEYKIPSWRPEWISSGRPLTSRTIAISPSQTLSKITKIVSVAIQCMWRALSVLREGFTRWWSDSGAFTCMHLHGTLVISISETC